MFRLPAPMPRSVQIFGLATAFSLALSSIAWSDRLPGPGVDAPFENTGLITSTEETGFMSLQAATGEFMERAVADTGLLTDRINDAPKFPGMNN